MSRLVVETDVVMHIRDGVELGADVYRVDDGAQRPVLLHRTPYNKANPVLVSSIVVDPLWLARRGYVVVVQDVRGRFSSGGQYEFFFQEHDDGYDAVEWAAAQPWSNGRVGVYGSSYHAMSTFQAVAARPPHLAAAVALVGAAGLEATVRPGGVFELGFLVNYLLAHSFDAVNRLEATDRERAALVARVRAALDDPLGTVSQLPIADIDPLGEGVLAPFWPDWVDAEPDSAYWRRDTLDRFPGHVQVPLLQVAGFMDFLSPTMFELFERIQHNGPHELVAGPWSHYGTYTGQAGIRDYRATAGGGPGTLGPVIAGWFDRWLRDQPAPTAQPRVRYFLSGENRWEGAPTWPPPSAEHTYYLHSHGHANTRAGDGRLNTSPEGPAVPDRFRYDPFEPVPSLGGMLASPALGPDGAQDRRVVQDRYDVLVYTSDELNDTVRVAGPVRLTVFLASSAEDTDVIATLVDVEPDGAAVTVSEGAQRARYRHGGQGPAWLVPGQVTELTVELAQSAHAFAPGHHIRLEVTSSNFPRLSRNLNTRTLPENGSADEAIPAEQTVYHDAQHPSRLSLHTV